MQSQMVLDRIQYTRAIQSSVASHGALVVRRLNERYATLVEGSGVPDFVPFLQSLATQLGNELEGLIEADNSHLRTRTRVTELRRQAWAQQRQLLATFLKVRYTLAGLFGTEDSQQLAGAEGNSPRNAVALLAQVRQTVELLESPEVAPPAATLGGVQVDLTALAQDLGPKMAAYEQTQVELRQARRQREAATVARQAAQAVFDAARRPVAGIVEGLMRLSGETELAERLRFNKPKRQKKPKDADGATEPAPAEPTPGDDPAVPTPQPPPAEGADDGATEPTPPPA